MSDPGSATGRGGGGGEGGGGPPPPRGFRATVEVVPRVRLSRFASGERGRERERERESGEEEGVGVGESRGGFHSGPGYCSEWWRQQGPSIGGSDGPGKSG